MASDLAGDDEAHQGGRGTGEGTEEAAAAEMAARSSDCTFLVSVCLKQVESFWYPVPNQEDCPLKRPKLSDYMKFFFPSSVGHVQSVALLGSCRGAAVRLEGHSLLCLALGHDSDKEVTWALVPMETPMLAD